MAAIVQNQDIAGRLREVAQAGGLQEIAPHQFNPKKAPCLPILHT